MIRIPGTSKFIQGICDNDYVFKYNVIEGDRSFWSWNGFWSRLLGTEKLRLAENYRFDTGLEFDQDYCSKYVYITAGGVFYLRKGYEWNGANGPTLDTEDTRLASCLHDASYEVLPKRYKKVVDALLRSLVDGIRGNIWYWALIKWGRGIDMFGLPATIGLKKWKLGNI